MTSQRRIDALRALAAQTESPNEAAIAREKLSLLLSLDDPDHDYKAWQVRERMAAERQRLADEAVIADIVRRWEQGAFSGATVNVGSANGRARYRGRP